MKILHVDDNQDITNLFSELVKSSDIEYVVTNDSKNGLDLIKNEKYDIILLDIHMPELSGFDIIQTLEKEKILKDQKIVILSGLPFDYNQKKNLLKKPGIHCCLKKPTEFNEILKIITE